MGKPGLTSRHNLSPRHASSCAVVKKNNKYATPSANLPILTEQDELEDWPQRELHIRKITRVGAKTAINIDQREAGAVEEVNSRACPFRSTEGGVSDTYVVRHFVFYPK